MILSPLSPPLCPEVPEPLGHTPHCSPAHFFCSSCQENWCLAWVFTFRSSLKHHSLSEAFLKHSSKIAPHPTQTQPSTHSPPLEHLLSVMLYNWLFLSSPHWNVRAMRTGFGCVLFVVTFSTCRTYGHSGHTINMYWMNVFSMLALIGSTGGKFSENEMTTVQIITF